VFTRRVKLPVIKTAHSKSVSKDIILKFEACHFMVVLCLRAVFSLFTLIRSPRRNYELEKGALSVEWQQLLYCLLQVIPFLKECC
jgi:hypothetical protein